MESREQTAYCVEYEMGGVIFTKIVSADSMEDAKKQVGQYFPQYQIRAVSVIHNEQS